MPPFRVRLPFGNNTSIAGPAEKSDAKNGAVERRSVEKEGLRHAMEEFQHDASTLLYEGEIRLNDKFMQKGGEDVELWHSFSRVARSLLELEVRLEGLGMRMAVAGKSFENVWGEGIFQEDLQGFGYSWYNSVGFDFLALEFIGSALGKETKSPFFVRQPLRPNRGLLPHRIAL